jgi:hypothetical protein
MARISSKSNRRRETRIEQEIVVDAYTSDERAMGWYYYLEQKLRFPFAARCTRALAISPLQVGESVTISGMAPEEHCMGEVLVMTRRKGRLLGLPLSQLSPCTANTATKTAIDDWHYWIARGYHY